MSTTCLRPGRSATFSANTSSSARSCSICSFASGRCTLTTAFVSVGEGRAVHLRDRAGRQRQRIDRLEHVLPRDAELLLHHADDLLLGQRGHVVLQGRELLDELGRHQVRSRRQDLAELGERRAELLERSSAAASPGGVGRRPRPRPAGRTAPSARAWRRPSRSWCRATSGAARSGSRPRSTRIVVDGRVTVVTSPSRVVFTMITVHRALWLMRFGTLPSRNSLRPAIPALPTTRTSMPCSSVACDDRQGGIVVDHHVRAAAFAGDLGRVRLQLLGRGAGTGDLGRPVLGVRGVERDHHLDDVQLRRVGVRERRRPLHRPFGRLGAVRAHHHAGDALRSAAPVAVGHDAASSQTRLGARDRDLRQRLFGCQHPGGFVDSCRSPE